MRLVSNMLKSRVCEEQACAGADGCGAHALAVPCNHAKAHTACKYRHIMTGLRLLLQALAQAEAHALRIDLEQRLAAATKEARGAREENSALREQLGKLLEEAAAGRAATDGAPLCSALWE